MSHRLHVRPCSGCGRMLTVTSFHEDMPILFSLCDRCATRSPEQRAKPRGRRFIVYVAVIIVALVAAYLYL